MTRRPEPPRVIRAVDVKSALAGLPVLEGRSAATPSEQVKAAFTTLAPFRDGSVFAGRFSGETAWERHTRGDELVQVLDGAARLIVMTADGPQALSLSAGTLVVVPRGHWHRFEAPGGVTVLSATPQPTEHSTTMDLRGGDPRGV